ncbi:YfcC family protein [Emergencia sp.]|uniref:YfcC family protein n=1 Tax=Emergencia sp. TaxID=1926557 RepID=UPI003AF0F8E4
MKKKKQLKEGEARQAVNPMIILAVIIILASIATYLIPAGEFHREPMPGTDYQKIDIDSFKFMEGTPIGIFDIFQSLTLGLQSAGSVIFFLLIIGGTFQIVEKTGALHAGLSNLVRVLKGKELIMIPASVFIFGLVSAFAACSEEYLAFIPLMYVVCVAAGFDSLTAVSLLMVSSAVGYAGGMTNAFTVGIAQEIAELPLFSGMGYRVVVFIVMAVITSLYLMRHAHKIKKHPDLNTMRETDLMYAEKLDVEEVEPMTGRQKLSLLIFGLGFAVVAFCVIELGFYIDEMSAIFLIVGILVVIVSGMKVNEAADNFVEGCRNMLWAAMIIGMCKAVTNILSDAGIMDTLIYYAGSVLEGLSAKISACGMFILQDLLNVLIPSGSGQAAITMPFMAPLSDLLGVSRQTAVLAFQMGDAFTNVVTPTSGELMAALAICHVPYKKWFKFLAPLWGLWAVAACVLLVIAVSIGY